MKICYPSFICLPSKLAHGVNVVGMCEAFSKKGVEIILVTPFATRSQEEILGAYGVRVPFSIKKPSWRFPLKGKLFFSLPLIFYVKKYIKPDVVYTRNLTLAFWSLVLGLPTILELHRTFTGMVKKMRLGYIFRHRFFIKLVVINKYLENYYFRFSDKVILCPDGVDPDKFPADPVRDSSPIVGYTGSLYKGKGVELIIKLAKVFPNVNFHVWGGDENRLSFWRSQTKDLPNLKFNGFVPHCQIYNILQRCKILLLPCQKEVYADDKMTDIAQWMSPLKLFEYMASGNPVIASDIPSIREILSDRKNALLASPDRIDDWKRALEFVFSNKEEAARIAAQAKNDVMEKYSWEKRAEKILEAMLQHHLF